MLVASVAVLVLCGLIALGMSGMFGKPQDKNPAEHQPVAVSTYIEPAAITPLKLAPLPREPEKLTQIKKPPVTPLQLPKDGTALIALVIDDCGIAEAGTRAAIALPPQVTLTFLPYGTKSGELAREAQGKGHNVLLHMPMQPVGRVDPGPNALTVGLPPEEITRRVHAAFAALPPVIGLNNHMGSRFTASEADMEPVIREIKRRNLFFLDSVTSPQSVAASVARNAGVPTLARDIFLDDIVTEDEVERELARAEAIARKRGVAIAIGHPHPSTLKVINRWLATHRDRGFRLVALHDLLSRTN